MNPKLFTIIIINTNKYLNLMLKLEQIELLDEHEIIIELMEPIVYTKVGSTMKSDDTIAKEKANVFYTTATIVRIPTFGESVKQEFKDKIKVGTNIIIARGLISPIQFPVEGYDRPLLGVINIYSTLAIIKENI